MRVGRSHGFVIRGGDNVPTDPTIASLSMAGSSPAPGPTPTEQEEHFSCMLQSTENEVAWERHFITDMWLLRTPKIIRTRVTCPLWGPPDKFELILSLDDLLQDQRTQRQVGDRLPEPRILLLQRI